MDPISPTLPTVGGDNAVWGSKNNQVHQQVISKTNEMVAAINAMPETIRDTIGAALVAGSNTLISVNDAADTITISSTATGGGGGGGISATVDGAQVASLAFSTAVTAADVSALPLPGGTPTVGQVAVVANASPLAMAWGNASTGGSSSGGTNTGSNSVIRPETFGAKADGQILTDLVVNQGSSTITSASNPFNSATDVGKVVYWRSGNTGYGKGTIASVQNSGSATLTSAASSGIQTDGGPNPNSYFGTDNTTAFNNAYAAAQAPAIAAGSNRIYHVTGREVRLSAGIYITRPLNTMTSWNVRTVGEGMDQTWVVCSEPGVVYNLATFNANEDYAFRSTVLNWGWFDMAIIDPIRTNGGALNARGQVVTGIQDNGNGSVTIERMRFKGLRYGYASAYGGDFVRLSHIYCTLCDVGTYFGPGAQQVEVNNPDYSDCREGSVFEGCQNWHMGGNPHFQDPRFSGVTVEAKPQGQTTRFGVQSNVGGGAFYNGRMTIDGNPWFETNSGNNGSICPRMIWLNGDGPYGQGITGFTVRDALFIAGGQQVPGGTNAFLEITTNYTEAQPFIIDNLYIGGTFPNYVVNSTGNANAIKPLLKYLRMDTTKIALQRNASGYKYISEDGFFHGYTAN